MAEFILPLAKSILGILAPIGGDIAKGYVMGEIQVAMAAKNDLKVIKEKFDAICANLQDAEDKRYTNETMKLWVKDLKNVVYDIDDLLDELAYDALLRSVNKSHFWRQTRYYLSTSSPILSRFNLGRKIKSLRDQLENIVSKKNDFNLNQTPMEASRTRGNASDSVNYVNTSTIVGRNEAKKDVIKRLISCDGVSTLSVLPIVGLGGIGKTALAKLVYQDIPNFDIKLWACVSEEFVIEKTLAAILENHGDDNASNLIVGGLMGKIQKLLKGKKFFLVLDDVWIDEVSIWTVLKDSLDFGEPGSVILITTRTQKVADITKTIESYDLDRLSNAVSMSLFERLAFKKGEAKKYPKLREISKSIVENCRGLPLLIKNSGGLLQNERNEMEWLERKNMVNTNLYREDDKHVMKQLILSYTKLPSYLKPYFAYLGAFGKDTIYTKVYQEEIMRALGLTHISYGDSEVGEQTFKVKYCAELFSRSMIHEIKMGFNGSIFEFKMHDMLHDVAVGELGEELSVVTGNELKVSESTRYVSWNLFEGSSDLSDNLKSLFIARKTRSLKFSLARNPVTRSVLEKIISNTTCLRILELGNSFINELPSSIGSLKHLRLLNLSRNPIKSLPDTICELLNLQTLYLTGCQQLEKLPKSIHRLVSLRCLYVTTRQKSLVGTKFNELPRLQRLLFISCTRLTTLWENNDVGRLASLKILCIKNCPKLINLPTSMKDLVNLEELFIIKCQELNMEYGDPTSGLVNLRYLKIREMWQMIRLPNALQSAAKTLQYLWVEKCGCLLELPNWLKLFASLRKLRINDCPHLSKRCAKSVGEDYPLIRHVPKILLDFPQKKKKNLVDGRIITKQ